MLSAFQNLRDNWKSNKLVVGCKDKNKVLCTLISFQIMQHLNFL